MANAAIQIVLCSGRSAKNRRPRFGGLAAEKPDGLESLNLLRARGGSTMTPSHHCAIYVEAVE